MQIIKLIEVRKDVIEAMKVTLNEAVDADRTMMDEALKDSGVLIDGASEVEYLPPFHPDLEPHALARAFEKALDDALRKHSAPADDAIAVASVNAKLTDYSLGSGKLILKVEKADNEALSAITDLHRSIYVTVISRQGSLFNDLDTENPDAGPETAELGLVDEEPDGTPEPEDGPEEVDPNEGTETTESTE